jgi:hypothetical protein
MSAGNDKDDRTNLWSMEEDIGRRARGALHWNFDAGDLLFCFFLGNLNEPPFLRA